MGGDGVLILSLLIVSGGKLETVDGETCVTQFWDALIIWANPDNHESGKYVPNRRDDAMCSHGGCNLILNLRGNLFDIDEHRLADRC